MASGEFHEQETGWVVMTPKHPVSGKVLVIWRSFRRTRKESIAEFLRDSGMNMRKWRRKFGYIAVKATADFRVSATIQNLKKMGMYD